MQDVATPTSRLRHTSRAADAGSVEPKSAGHSASKSVASTTNSSGEELVEALQAQLITTQQLLSTKNARILMLEQRLLEQSGDLQAAVTGSAAQSTPLPKSRAATMLSSALVSPAHVPDQPYMSPNPLFASPAGSQASQSTVGRATVGTMVSLDGAATAESVHQLRMELQASQRQLHEKEEAIHQLQQQVTNLQSPGWW